MNKKLKIKFYIGILLGVIVFAFCSYSAERISVPLEIGIGAMLVMATSVLVDNYKNNLELVIREWQFKIFYSGFLIVLISCAVFCADNIKKYLK